jgi:phospholipid/cholesterol/gamma-HCH transport system substrate-binding protein
MAKRASPTLIGVFVLGGIALAVCVVLVVGGRAWFKRPVTCVMAFDGSVAGLTVGSPVSFRGVQLGTVSSIQLRSNTTLIVVFVQIDPSRIQGLPRDVTRAGVEGSIHDAVQNGLRGQLQLQSLITGQLYVGLDYYPDTPVKLTGVDPDYCEIPTIPTALAQVQDQMKKIMAELEQLPLKQIVESAARTIDGVDKLVSSPEIRRALTSADVTLKQARTLITNLNSKIDPAVTSLVRTLDQAQQTMDGVGRDVRRLVQDVDTQVGPLATNLGATSDSARVLMQDAQRTLQRLDEQIGPTMVALRHAADAAQGAMRKAETALGQVDGVLDGNSPLGYQLAEALEQLARTAGSLRILSEEIDRQPNLLLFGRGGPRN